MNANSKRYKAIVRQERSVTFEFSDQEIEKGENPMLAAQELSSEIPDIDWELDDENIEITVVE